MRILFLSHYFAPEGNAPATRVHELTRRWARAGHDVTVITCAPNVPAGVVYDFTRAMFEARSALVARFPLAGFVSPLDEDADSAIPAHPGARRYFDREKPGLLAQNARLASALLYTVVLLGSGLLALRSHWLKTRRLRMGVFNQRLMEIAASTRDNEDYHALMDNKNRLMDILTEVVGDLDKDVVSQEEFEHFSFTWQAVDALVRDQLLVANTAAVQHTPRAVSS